MINKMQEPEPTNVNYFISLKNLEPQSSFEDALRKISTYSQINVVNTLDSIGTLIVTTPKQEFEKLYQVSLYWNTKTVNNINTGPFQVSDWVMTGKPKVPKDLEDYVAGIQLDRKVYLTD